MQEWKPRDTIVVIFMAIVVGFMLMQMVQSDRLYERVSQLIRTLESGSHSMVGTATGAAGRGAWLVPGAEPGGTATIAYNAQPSNLNPVTYKDYYAGIILSIVYPALLERDPDTLEVKGRVARDWTISEDKLVLTFELRPDAVWSDGRQVTAHDVEFSFRTLMIPQVDAQRLQTYFIDVEKVEAISDTTVRFTMKKRYFKSLEMAGGLAIIPRHVIDPEGLIDSDPKALAEILNNWNAFWDGKTPVTCGPFLLHSWDKTANQVVLRRNDRYWDPLPPLQRLAFKFIPNDVARLQALKGGNVDMLPRLDAEQWQYETDSEEFLKQFEKKRFKMLTDGYNYFGYNQRRWPFDDRRVRHALSHCVPREQILEKIFYNLRELANSPFGLGSPQSNPSVGQWPFDPDKARQLLAEAGFTDTDGDGILDRDGRPFRFGISIPAGSVQYEQVCALFQDELSKVGVKMDINPYEWSVFEEKLNQRDYEVCMLGWGGVVENDAYQVWHSSSAEGRGSNHVGFAHEEVDRLIEEARVEFDVEKRNVMYHRIHEIIFQEQPYTFLFEVTTLSAYHKRLQNVQPTLIGYDFTILWVPVDQRRSGE